MLRPASASRSRCDCLAASFRCYLALVSLAWLATAGVSTQVSDAADAVVTVYADTATGSSQGTGFFTSRSGHVLTAYHVVVGARQVRVVHERLGTLTNVRLDRISPAHDLALLQVEDPFGATPFLTLDRAHIPNPADNYRLVGFPRDGVRQEFRTQPTSRGFISSLTIREARRSLFAGDIAVIPLDATIYSGMSGGPVIGTQGVVGVLSGSFQEGGTLAWAIPLVHVDAMHPVNKAIADLGAWPPLTLMATSWGNVRALVRVHTTAARMYDLLCEEIETLAQQYSEASRLANQTRIKFDIARPFLERLVTQGARAVASDARAPMRDAMSSFKQFSDTSESLGETGRRVAAALTGLFAWVQDEAGLSDAAGRALVADMRRIRNQYQDLQPGLDTYLGLDRQKLARALPELQQTARDTSVAGEARAFLHLFDTFTPVLDAYGSAKALMFMSRDIAKYRRTTNLFEPVVYQR